MNQPESSALEGKPFLIEVIESGDCPMDYKKGDIFSVSYHAIKPPTGKQMCVFALSNAGKAIEAFLNGGKDLTFTCGSCAKIKTKFLIKEIPKNSQIHSQIADQLKGFSLFRLMHKTELEMTARDIHLKKYEAGERILNVGDPGEAFYIIHSGKVDVLGQDKHAPEKFNLIVTLGVEDCFGEMSLLTNEPCSTRILANTKTTILTIRKDAFQRMVQDNQAINRYFFRLMATRLKNTNDKVSHQNLVSGIAGSLSALPLVEIVQIFKSSASTGVLKLKIKENVAKIEIQMGEIYSAEYQYLSNEQAFFALVSQKEGEFQFERSQSNFERKIKIPTTGLLMESMRVMDESSKN